MWYHCNTENLGWSICLFHYFVEGLVVLISLITKMGLLKIHIKSKIYCTIISYWLDQSVDYICLLRHVVDAALCILFCAIMKLCHLKASIFILNRLWQAIQLSDESLISVYY